MNKIISTITKVILGFVLANTCIVSCDSQDYSNISIYDSRLNNETDPKGIDIEKPDFSWKLRSHRRNRYQEAYQIVVWSENPKDTCWNSAKVVSDNNIEVKYSGRSLKPLTTYKWKLRIWDNDEKVGSWSDENHFTTGLMGENDWKAEWISSPDSVYAPVFIKEFHLDDLPDQTTVFVNCQGYFELYVNGKKVGKDVLSPAVGDFTSENYYLTYDIKNHLKKGKNTIGIWTGRGWYRPGLPGVVHPSPVFRLQAHLVLGHTSKIVISDTSWKTTNSNISQIGSWYWNNFGGELIDNRISMKGWKAGIIEKGVKNAIKISKPQATTESQICRPNTIMDTIFPKHISQIDKNVWLVDMGKNFTGWLQMNMKDQNEGDTVDFIYSDFCDKLPEKKSRYVWDFGNEGIGQVDGYVFSENDNGIFSPKFNYHGFRYVIIQGLKYKPKKDDILGLMIESKLDRTGNFTSSDKDLNNIYEINHYTFRCLNLGGYFVDCPHRERLGYGGDGQVAIETGIYNFDLKNFYKKWARNWLSAQDEHGEFPNTAPSPYPAGGGPAWGGMGVVLPWKLYKYYGDIEFLGASYDSMVRYLDFLETKSLNGVLKRYGHATWGFLGDWLPPGKGNASKHRTGKIEREVFNNCHKLYMYHILTESAKVLGKSNDAVNYKKKAELLRVTINKEYFNTEKGIYASGKQAYLSFPLLLGVPPEKERNRVLANLEHELKNTHNGHLDTGMLGTYFMLQYLTEIGRSDLVYLFMKQKTYPGWGYMLAKGANTIWEDWNGYSSNIHSTYTSGGAWFSTGIAGIRQMKNSVAFKHLLIAPQLTDVINHQKTEFNSPYGKVLVSWKHKKNRDLQLEIEIPVNTKADIVLSVSANETVYESGKKISEIDEIEVLSKQMNSLRLRVVSGKYIFDIRNKD